MVSGGPSADVSDVYDRSLKVCALEENSENQKKAGKQVLPEACVATFYVLKLSFDSDRVDNWAFSDSG